MFADLLGQWNASVNLVGQNSLGDLARRHIDDSGQLGDMLPAVAGTLIDIGSGAGFPGLILAILHQEWAVTLVDSDRRKAAFLQHAASSLRLTNVTVLASRAENLEVTADIVTARAVAPLSRLLQLVAPRLRDGGCALLPKGRKVEEELADAARIWNFQVERIPSRTEDHATILKLSEIVRIYAQKPRDESLPGRRLESEGRRR
jgi:16S rRNA (guanine527-N7)-methyltransferase